MNFTEKIGEFSSKINGENSNEIDIISIREHIKKSSSAEAFEEAFSGLVLITKRLRHAKTLVKGSSSYFSTSFFEQRTPLALHKTTVRHFLCSWLLLQERANFGLQLSDWKNRNDASHMLRH